jgi:imidazolonepropionase-like amidohydrolase
MMKGNFRLADGVDDCRKAVREQLREGADFIKICTTGGIMSQQGNPKIAQFCPDELRVLVEESHNHGKRVASHAQGLKGIINAIRAGVDSIEHGTFLDEVTAEEMAEKGVFLVPTLSLIHKIATEGSTYGISPWALRKGVELNEVAAKSFDVARKGGVRIASGTDFSGAPPMRHGENALELSLMVQAGMTAPEAISGATQVAAEVLGLGDLTGTLEKGKWADLLVIEGDPLENISLLSERSRVRMVVKEGRIVVER